MRHFRADPVLKIMLQLQCSLDLREIAMVKVKNANRPKFMEFMQILGEGPDAARGILKIHLIKRSLEFKQLILKKNSLFYVTRGPTLFCI